MRPRQCTQHRFSIMRFDTSSAASEGLLGGALMEGAGPLSWTWPSVTHPVAFVF